MVIVGVGEILIGFKDGVVSVFCDFFRDGECDGSIYGVSLVLFTWFVLNSDGELVLEEGDDDDGKGDDNGDGNGDCDGSCSDDGNGHIKWNDVGVYAEMSTYVTLSFVEYWLEGLEEIVTDVL